LKKKTISRLSATSSLTVGYGMVDVAGNANAATWEVRWWIARIAARQSQYKTHERLSVSRWWGHCMAAAWRAGLFNSLDTWVLSQLLVHFNEPLGRWSPLHRFTSQQGSRMSQGAGGCSLLFRANPLFFGQTLNLFGQQPAANNLKIYIFVFIKRKKRNLFRLAR